jgi:hypothetical protein
VAPTGAMDRHGTDAYKRASPVVNGTLRSVEMREIFFAYRIDSIKSDGIMDPSIGIAGDSTR